MKKKEQKKRKATVKCYALISKRKKDKNKLIKTISKNFMPHANANKQTNEKIKKGFFLSIYN